MPGVESLVGGAVSALQSYGNMQSQAVSNGINMGYNMHMYNLSRRHMKEDRDFANAYNHPTQQMKRLQEAGISPHLAYTSGAGGQSTVSPQPRTPTADVKPPQMQGNPLEVYFDMRVKEQQLENLKAQEELIKENTKLTYSKNTTEGYKPDLLAVEFDTKRRAYDNSFKTFPFQLELLKERGRLASAQTGMTLDENKRRELMKIPALQNLQLRNRQLQLQGVETNQRIRLLEKEGLIKDFEIQLNKLGLSSKDGKGWRMGSKLLEYLGIEL